jgi:hypothetical protein
MSNLLDLLALVINIVSIFASVSFAASAATGAIIDVLQLRAKSLLRGLQDLLFDPAFKGLARALYNHVSINPLGNGNLQSKSELRLNTTTIDPQLFAATILQILHVVPYGNAPYDKNNYRELDTPGLTEQERIDNAKHNAGLVIEQMVAEGSRPHVTTLVDNLITLNRGDRPDMEKAAAAWFNTGMAQVGEQFARRVRFFNFVVAFLIAAVLDLKPIPLGGFGAMLAFKPATPPGTSMAGSLPYVVAGFQWLLVGLSSLPGAQFWYSVLTRLTTRPRTG